MTIGRSFQSATRYANILRSAWRSSGSAGFDSFMRGSFRVTGVLSSSTWSAQSASQRPRFPVAQPTYGFAAQGVQLSVDNSGSSDCADAGSCSTTAVASSSSDDSECLASNEEEGVIPRRWIQLTSGPPWPDVAALRSTQQHPSPAGLSCSAMTGPPSSAAVAGRLADPPTSSTGLLLRHPSSAAGGRQPGCPQPCARLFGSQAAAERGQSEPAFPHPSRPGHAQPAAHHPHAHETEAAGGPEAAGPAGGRLSGEEYRRRHQITVDDPSCPDPIQEFEGADLPEAVVDVLKSLRYTAPSTIQAQAWPIAMAGRDLVAIASTGSGKTLGFLLPALVHIQKRAGDPALGPTALVLAPTRELARQIQTEADRFRGVMLAGGAREEPGDRAHGRRSARGGRAAGAGLRTACLYGGASRSLQYRDLQRLPQLIIATPGRLRDFMESGEVDLHQVTYLVLDEADRMLDMGFEPQINEIANALPENRQTLFFSATWPQEVQQVAERFARRRPVHVFIGGVQDKPVAATTIRQRVQIVPPLGKLAALEGYLREQLMGEGGGSERDQRRAMVFVKTKAGADHLAWQINNRMPFQAASLHGDKTQAARDFALAKFRSGQVPVLVATDVAARGLDIPRVTAVVNYDMPEDIDMYVHRIGRTGRAGASGESMALITETDAPAARSLVAVLEGAGQEVPSDLRAMAARGGPARRFHRRPGGSWGESRFDTRGGKFSYERAKREREGERGEEERGYRGDRRRAFDGDDDGHQERRQRRHHADDWRSGEVSSRAAYGRARG